VFNGRFEAGQSWKFRIEWGRYENSAILFCDSPGQDPVVTAEQLTHCCGLVNTTNIIGDVMIETTVPNITLQVVIVVMNW
jgi:hypothetical protein